MGMPGQWELLLIFFVVLLLFGPKKLPALARSFGQSISGFKKGMKDVDEELEGANEDIKTSVKEIKKELKK